MLLLTIAACGACSDIIQLGNGTALSLDPLRLASEFTLNFHLGVL
jgi:hypothetical protein